MLTHHLPSSTHTVEMSQLAQLNDRLTSDIDALRVTAGELGMAEVPDLSDPAATLPARAVLTRLGWDGPPEFPYIHAHFTYSRWQDTPMVVQLHSTALRILSRRAGLRHRWGM
jgi:hypothetical protein